MGDMNGTRDNEDFPENSLINNVNIISLSHIDVFHFSSQNKLIKRRMQPQAQ